MTAQSAQAANTQSSRASIASPRTAGSPAARTAQTGAHFVVGPPTGAHAVVADAVDPARRQDVLLRVRREEGHEVSVWWMVGAFVLVSGTVVALMSFIPGGGS